MPVKKLRRPKKRQRNEEPNDGFFSKEGWGSQAVKFGHTYSTNTWLDYATMHDIVNAIMSKYSYQTIE